MSQQLETAKRKGYETTIKWLVLNDSRNITEIVLENNSQKKVSSIKELQSYYTYTEEKAGSNTPPPEKFEQLFPKLLLQNSTGKSNESSEKENINDGKEKTSKKDNNMKNNQSENNKDFKKKTG